MYDYNDDADKKQNRRSLMGTIYSIIVAILCIVVISLIMAKKHNEPIAFVSSAIVIVGVLFNIILISKKR